MARRPLTVIGFLGTNRDRAPRGTARAKVWRPSVALCQYPALRVTRLVLLHGKEHLALAETVATDVREASPSTEVKLETVVIGDPWDLEEVYRALFDFSVRFSFDPAEEDYLVHITTGTHVAQVALFLLVEWRYLPARLLQSIPPAPGEKDRVGSYRITDVDLSRFESLARRFRAEHEKKERLLKANVVTLNSDYNCLIAQIERVAATSDPILLLGPTGAGKSDLARRIYELKKERGLVKGDFLLVDCAGLRGEQGLSSSTLFGHERGAYTGAQKQRTGRLRLANKGVLFLDEIGDLGLTEQGMLLQALETKAFLPLGSERVADSNFQLVAATNRELSADVRAGRFREDLLARIKLWTFKLPSLRERPEDIKPNLDKQLEREAESLKHRVSMTRDAKARYLAFATSPAAVWSANFRDLRDSVRRMAVMSPAGCIGTTEVDEEIERLRDEWAEGLRVAPEATSAPWLPAFVSSSPSSSWEELLGRERAAAIDPFDRVQLAEVIAVCRRARSLSDAGRILFAVSRTQRKKPNDADRLRKYLARHRLSFEALQGWPSPARR